MKKIIELADLHLDNRWIEEQKKCLATIIETAKKEKPDAICSAGDFFNRQLYASDKSSYSEILDFAEKLIAIAPLVMISGTKSHDGPGCYEPLQKIGAHILKPNKPEVINGILFLGLPEPDKIAYMNSHNCSADEANVQIQKHINALIGKFFLPAREMHKDKPCVFLGHGMYFDNWNPKDIILQNTDIPIDNKEIAKIGSDRYVLGHLHKPSMSKVLNGGYVGYAGFDDHPWNNTGFQPGFNVTMLGGETKRIYYPVLRKEVFKKDIDAQLAEGVDVRVKICLPQEKLKSFDIESEEEELKEKYKMNSCQIILEVEKSESQRIDSKEYENVKTLPDLYLKFNPEASASLLAKVSEVEKNASAKKSNTTKKEIEMVSLKVHGSIFSITGQNKETFYHEFQTDPNGLTIIYGPNGTGKSTFIGFANPYPMFLGFDYKTLKDFFELDDSEIEKYFRINGHLHRHLIQIRKSKIECFWYRDDEPYLMNLGLKEMMEKCIEEFGPVETFVITNFQAQEPHRMAKIPSICSAGKAELRDVYMQIVGIDRTAEKEYSKQKKEEVNKKIEHTEIELQKLNQFVSDADTIKAEIDRLKKEIAELEKENAKCSDAIESAKNKAEKTVKLVQEQDRIDAVIQSLNSQLTAKQAEYYRIVIPEVVENVDELKLKIANNATLGKEISDIRQEYINQKEIVDGLVKTEADAKNKIASLTANTEYQQKEIMLLSTKCEKCGHIANNNQVKIKSCESIISDNETKKKTQEDILSDIELKLKAEKEELAIILKSGEDKKKLLLTAIEEAEINEKIKSAAERKTLEETKAAADKEVKSLAEKIAENSKKINAFIKIQYESEKRELEEAQVKFNESAVKIASNKGILKATEENYSKIEENKKEIELLLTTLDEYALTSSEWERLEKDFSPNKLPALELDVISKEIDAMINAVLPERYIVETTTQEINKKGDIIDRFDIVVYDSFSGVSKSLAAHSPGQKAWLNESISYALRTKRQQRENLFFNWSISDEIDGPLNQDVVQDYYQVLNASAVNTKRYVISHSPEAFNYAPNKISSLEF